MENLITQSTNKMKKKLIENFEMVIAAHDLSKSAIANSDVKKSMKVLKLHDKFIANYILFESDILFALAKKPLAKNLRATISYLIIMKELESISNYARKMVRFAIAEENTLADSSKKRIRKIHKPVRGMMDITLQILLTEDKNLIPDILHQEEEVEKIVTSLRKKIFNSVALKNGKEEIEQRLYMFNVINAQERAGDHLISICELVMYIKTGSHIILE